MLLHFFQQLYNNPQELAHFDVEKLQPLSLTDYYGC